jgi:hypothetical protein
MLAMGDSIKRCFILLGVVMGNSSILFFAVELSGGATVLPPWHVLCRLRPDPHTLLSADRRGEMPIAGALYAIGWCIQMFEALLNLAERYVQKKRRCWPLFFKCY